MSLEIAITDGNYALVVRDGLAWNGDQVVDEHARKQIELGKNIVVTAGGDFATLNWPLLII